MQRKNMFSASLDEKELNYECSELEIRRISAALCQEKKEIDALFDKQISRMVTGSLHIIIIKLLLAMLGGLLFAIGGYMYFSGETASGIPIVIAAVCFAVVAVLSFIKKDKDDGETDEDKALSDRFDRHRRACADYLSVPADAKEIDVFTNLYTKKVYEGIEKAEYANETMSVFAEDGKLCLFFYDRIYGIPIDSITEITLVNKRVVFDGWNKEESYDSEEYAEYRITETEGGNLETGAYYSVRFSYGGVDYELVIPPYDESPIPDITKIRVSFETPVDLGNGLVIGVKKE